MADTTSADAKGGSGSTYSLGGSLKSGRSGSLFDYFMVVGLPPTEIKQEDVGLNLPPQILYSFPPEQKNQCVGLPYRFGALTPMIDDNIKNFCFPNGVETRWVQSRRFSSTDLHKVVFGSLSELESSENSFIFLVTKDVLLYGVCVYVNELLGDPSGLVREAMGNADLDAAADLREMLEGPLSPVKMSAEAPEPATSAKASRPGPKPRVVANGLATPLRREAFHASLRKSNKTANDVVTKRCYCFVTRFPFFSLHFEVLYGLLARDRLYKLTRIRGEVESEGAISALLRSYYEQPVPKAGELASFNLSNELRSVKFVCPPLDDITSLAEWTIAAKFKMLSLDIIIQLFTAVLTEGRTVIICKDLGILSAISISLIPTIRPLVWQGILIPVLPAMMMDCLDAPVPIVLGVQNVPEYREDSLAELLVVDVDENKMTLPSTGMEELPQKKELMAQLEPYHKKLYKRANRAASYGTNPCRTTEAEVELVRCITKIFRDYINKFLDVFKTAVVTQKIDLATDFETKIQSLVPHLPKTYKKFSKLFFETQQFNFYSEKFVKSITKTKADDQQLFDRLVGLLKMELEEKTSLDAQMKTAPRGDARDRVDRELKAVDGRLFELKKQLNELIVKYPDLQATITSSGIDLSSDSVRGSPSLLHKWFPTLGKSGGK